MSGNYRPPYTPLYLTPNSIPVGRFCRTISIPDDPIWIGLVDGVLSALNNPEVWRQYGLLTPEETAEAWQQMMSDSWEIEGCPMPFAVRQSTVTPCILEFSIDNEITWTEFADLQRCPPVMRRLANNTYQPGMKLPDNSFGYFDADEGPASTGLWDDYQPPVGFQVQTNDKCTAAANAANVIRQLYTEVGTHLLDNTPQIAAGTVDAIIAAIETIFVSVSAGLVVATVMPALAAIQAAYAWTAMSDKDFHDLACIFYANMTGTNGNWLSDMTGLTAAINAKAAANPVPWLMIRELLVFIGDQGVELAMKTTAIASYDCTAGTSVVKWRSQNSGNQWGATNLGLQFWYSEPAPASLGLWRAQSNVTMTGAAPQLNPFNPAVSPGYTRVNYPGGSVLTNGSRDVWMFNGFFFTSITALAAIRKIMGNPAYNPTQLVQTGTPAGDPFPAGTFAQMAWQLNGSTGTWVNMTQTIYTVQAYGGC